MIEHHIQRGILQRLMHAQHLRFSELKAPGMESNIFMYHIRNLQRAGYIAKDDQGYVLLPAGLSYVDALQTSNHLKPTKQPKTIAIIALQNNDDEWLLVTRKTQPYINEYMFLSGQQHFGESIFEQVERELQDKNIHGVALTYCGLADIRIDLHETVLTHVVAHVHHGIYDGILPPEDDQFVYAWSNMKRAQNLMAGTAKLYEQLCDRESYPFIITLRVPANQT